MNQKRSLAFRSGAVVLLASLTLAACADDEGTSTAGGDDAAAKCGDVASLPLVAEGKLTVATGEPAFLPWVADDKPESGEGYEAALVYALAEEMGFAKEDVTWTRTGFDEAIAPGDKAYDFNIQQFSITEERDEVVDFSDGYYTVEQALVAAKDSKIVGAKSIADLKDAKLGAAIGTTSLDYAENVIQPTAEVAVFDDNAAAKAAFDAGQVDGLVFDLPTAYYITAAEIPDSSIVGVLPAADEAEELGMLFTDGSALVPCVNEALAALTEAGTVAELDSEYLKAGGDIPTLAK